MSKIYDALQGAQNETANLLSTLIPDEPPAPVYPAAGNVGDDPPPPMPPAFRPAVEEEPPLAVAPQIPEPVVFREVADRDPLARMPIRQIHLALPASTPVLPFEDPREPAAEKYRIARTKILHHPKRPRMIIISSPVAGDGKSLTAINLSGILSLKGDAQVLLMDADFRRSAMHIQLGLPESPGLSEVLLGGCSFDQAVVQLAQYPNMHVLVNGDLQGMNPGELLDTARWRELCQLLRTRYQYIIVDSSPVASVADFELTQMAADGTILVVRPDHTKRSACMKAIESIAKDKFLGVILNCAERWFLTGNEGYGYEYKYADVSAKAKVARA